MSTSQEVLKTLRKSIKDLPDAQKVSIRAGDLRAVGIKVDPLPVEDDEQPVPIPDDRPVSISVADLRAKIEIKTPVAPPAKPTT